jgi:hypothetical protein
MGCGESGVDLNGVAELNYRFLVLASGHVFAAAGKVGGFSLLRIAGAGAQNQN